GPLHQPVDPGREVVPAVIDNLVGRPQTPSAALGDRAADAVVAPRVDPQHAAAQGQQALGEAVEQGRGVEVAAGAVDEAEGVHGDGRCRGGGAEGAVEADAVVGGDLNELDEHGGALLRGGVGG